MHGLWAGLLNRRGANAEEEEFREMELWEHLAELRTRIIRTLIYIGVAAAVLWIFFDYLWAFLWHPLKPILDRFGSKVITTSIMEMFMVQLQICLVGGLIAAVPLITYEIWGFIAPGLTRKERKGFYFVGPMAVGFFLLGVTTAYLVLPAAFNYFAGFLTHSQGPGVTFLPQATPYVLFLIKMCLAFGLVFELPVILMFFGWIGLINSGMMLSYWRHAVVACAAVAAVATPSNDAPTMLMMAVPLIGLYFVSIALVKFVERIRGKRAASHWDSWGESAPAAALPEGQEESVDAESPADESPHAGVSD
jgi:sec-independent protein translocase protein TatC